MEECIVCRESRIVKNEVGALHARVMDTYKRRKEAIT